MNLDEKIAGLVKRLRELGNPGRLSDSSCYACEVWPVDEETGKCERCLAILDAADALEGKGAYEPIAIDVSQWDGKSDFACPTCSERIPYSQGMDEYTVGSFVPSFPHVHCPNCGKCAGCKLFLDGGDHDDVATKMGAPDVRPGSD